MCARVRIFMRSDAGLMRLRGSRKFSGKGMQGHVRFGADHAESIEEKSERWICCPPAFSAFI